MAMFTRQPFAELGTPRLQALQSAKNRQNAITPNTPSKFASPLKPSPTASTGKRRAPAIFEDDDSENVDPSIFNSPSKKSKTSDGLSKPSKFSLVASPLKHSSPLTASPASIPSVRKALSSPNTTNSTPIGHSRGSPKHKRIGALAKRRASTSPFRRVDPPSFGHSSPALPFSIDAALSGTIPNYTPKPAATPTPVPAAPAPSHVPVLEEPMPKSWFFEIHEDTPEQEAANLMEHSAAVLDISSDDDMETKKRNEELERGKENIPPPDFALPQPHAQQQGVDPMESTAAEQHVKMPRLRKIMQDAMDEDRKPLGDLPAAEFYGEGCDASSYVTVDAGIEKPSGLSKEFEFNCPSPEKEKPEVPSEEEPVDAAGQVEASGKPGDGIAIYSDEPAVVAAQEEGEPAASSSEPEPASSEVL